MGSVYALCDPHTLEVRYVGKTIKTLNHRLQIHLWAAARSARQSHVLNWIRTLPQPPAMVRLESADSDDVLIEREKYWIALLREQGARLTNMTDGGEGLAGHRHSEETKAKIAELSRGRPHPHRISPTLGASISAARTGQPHPHRGHSTSERTKQRIGHSNRNSAAVKRASRKTCSRGHAYSTENIYVDKKGWWHCRPCNSENARNRRRGKIEIGSTAVALAA